MRMINLPTPSEQLNQLTLTGFVALFQPLTLVTVEEMNGRFSSEFIGPAWLRRSAPHLLKLGGLGNWWGKTFDGHGQGLNLVQRGDTIRAIIPVVLEERPSLLDTKPTLTIVYPTGSRFPWPWIVDELRRLDANTLLGLTMVTRFGLQRFAFPFLLHQVNSKTQSSN